MTLKNVVVGIFAGICWTIIPILILIITGTITFTGSNSIKMLPIWLFSCLLNVIMQELLVRGYIYQLLKKNYNFPVAIIITTALFVIMHGGAFEEGIIPVLCVITMSLAMTFVMEYTGSLLAPIIMHFIWNSVGAIICNVVALADDYPHVLNAFFSGSNIMTGGSCKIEGSIIVLVTNSIIILISAVMLKKKQVVKSVRF